jgi:AcrR family transcriptional regulator
MRRRLLAAGGEIISKGGFPKLRVEELAERAGVSVGTFYLYFEGKADLFAQLVMEITERLRERIRVVSSGDAPILERLGRALDAYLDVVEEGDKGFLYFRDAGSVHTAVGSLTTWTFQQHAAWLRPLLEEAMRAGEIREEDPEILAHAAVGLVHHMAGYWLENRDHVDRAELRTFLLRFAAQGVRGTAVPARAEARRGATKEGKAT